MLKNNIFEIYVEESVIGPRYLLLFNLTQKHKIDKSLIY